MQLIYTPTTMSTTGSNGPVGQSQAHPAQSMAVHRVLGADPFIGHGGT